jgi:hypothetical protein
MCFGQAAYRFPFMDLRVLAFCLAAPAEFKIKNGFKRYLVRAGPDGIYRARFNGETRRAPSCPIICGGIRRSCRRYRSFWIV